MRLHPTVIVKKYKYFISALARGRAVYSALPNKYLPHYGRYLQRRNKTMGDWNLLLGTFLIKPH